MDARRHLLVAHEAIGSGIDRNQLATVAEQVREVMGTEGLIGLPDRYDKGEQTLPVNDRASSRSYRPLTGKHRFHL